jgi:hypothetical protein
MSVWQTTTGDSWEFLWQAPLNPEGRWDARVGCAGPDVVWVLFVGEGGALSHKPYVLYRSTDGGQQWAAILAEAYTSPSYPTVRPRAREPGSYPGPFAAVSERLLLFLAWDPSINETVTLARTDDGGQSWQRHAVQPLAGSLPGNRGVSFADSEHGWIVSRDATKEEILATTDGGTTWIPQYP